jgi:hypothetical protein
VTDRYLYIIEDSRSFVPGRPLMNAINNRHHGCRFIVGEDIKYAQEKGYLWILDPDGRECKVPVLRQQVKSRRQARRNSRLKPTYVLRTMRRNALIACSPSVPNG